MRGLQRQRLPAQSRIACLRPMRLLRFWQLWSQPPSRSDLEPRRFAVLVGALLAMIALSLLTQGLQWMSLAIDGAATTVAFLGVNVLVCATSVGLLRLTRRGKGRLAAWLLASVLGLLSIALAITDGAQNPVWGVLVALMVVFCATVLGAPTSARALGLCAIVLVPVAVLQVVGAIEPLDAPRASAPVTILPNVVVLLALTCVMLLIIWLSGRERAAEASRGPELEVTATNAPRRVRTLYLSERERDVATLVVAGLSNEAIAERLGVSPRTVQTHVANARKKSGCANRTELGVLAVREGLVSMGEDADGDVAGQTTERLR